MIDCAACGEQLSLYNDGELSASQTLAIETHLAQCASCASVQGEALALRDALRTRAPYFRADSSLRERLNQQLGIQAPAAMPLLPVAAPSRASAPRPDQSRWLRWALPLAASLAIVVVGNGQWSQRRAEASLTDEIISAHVRSLMVDHIADVISTDQHTVKPWFSGKLDYSPPVRDLATVGFPLTGGRLDYIAHQKVAVLVYQRRLHEINVFIWPDEGEPDQAPNKAPLEHSLNGYQIIRWRANRMQYWAISDVNRDELNQFVEELRK